MRAVVIHQFGPPGQLTVEEVAKPQPRGDEILVAVKAAAINPSDVKNVAGKMHGTTLPRIPGRDFAGVVVAGPAELIGREVWGTGGEIGFTRDGSHAEFILLPRDGVTEKPSGMSMEAAGSAGVTFVTAWSAMVSAAGVGKDEFALIIGAAGGVGSAAVQIARAQGARVIGAVRGRDDFAAVRRNGVETVIDTQSEELATSVNKITAGEGANVVFDTSGMMLAQAVAAAAMDGRIPVITAPADGMASLNLRDLYHQRIRILGVDTRPMDSVQCAALLAKMRAGFESGAFKAKESRSMPLASAVEAYQRAGGGERVVLRPGV